MLAISGHIRRLVTGLRNRLCVLFIADHIIAKYHDPHPIILRTSGHFRAIFGYFLAAPDNFLATFGQFLATSDRILATILSCLLSMI